MKRRNQYIDRDQLRELMQDYNKTNVVSEQLGKMFMIMTDRILGHSNFKNYTKDLKEEMKSHAFYLLMKYIHNCDAYERDAKSVFNYITTTIFNAYRQVLKKHYSYMNTKRALETLYIATMENIYGIDIKNDYLENFKLDN